MKKDLKRQDGITLVALVITIIILIILAGISIASLTNSGLFGQVEKTKQETKNAQELEEQILEGYENEVNKYTGGPQPITTEKLNTVLSTKKNTILIDANGNKIVVPAGFKIVSDSTTNNAKTVDKGIVVEDATGTATNGSQFVWIPVPQSGKIYTNTAKTEYKEIALGRYDFADGTNGTTLGAPTAYAGIYVEEDQGDSTFTLLKKGNTIAKNITNFKNSVRDNEGYYIGRYEARTATARSSENDTLTQVTEKGSSTDYVYNYVTQLQAAQQCKDMYASTNPFTSDLMNSYAWDTATLFLQNCGTNPTYSRQHYSVNRLLVTGSNNYSNTSSKDVQCNVYDMANNYLEWTTETSQYTGVTYRGGYWCSLYSYTCSRGAAVHSDGLKSFGFRPLLYL